MEQSDWMKLKSGTDVRGVALEGVPGEEVNLTDEAVTGIMKAFCAWAAMPCSPRAMPPRPRISSSPSSSIWPLLLC